MENPSQSSPGGGAQKHPSGPVFEIPSPVPLPVLLSAPRPHTDLVVSVPGEMPAALGSSSPKHSLDRWAFIQSVLRDPGPLC